MSGRSVLAALDKERHLRYSVNALSDLEQVMGVGLGEMYTAAGGLGIRTVRACLWAGLKHEDPDLTIAATGELMQQYLDGGGSFQNLGDAIHDALALAGFGAQPTEAGSGGAGPFGSGSGSTPPST